MIVAQIHAGQPPECLIEDNGRPSARLRSNQWMQITEHGWNEFR